MVDSCVWTQEAMGERALHGVGGYCHSFTAPNMAFMDPTLNKLATYLYLYSHRNPCTNSSEHLVTFVIEHSIKQTLPTPFFLIAHLFFPLVIVLSCTPIISLKPADHHKLSQSANADCRFTSFVDARRTTEAVLMPGALSITIWGWFRIAPFVANPALCFQLPL